MKRAILTVELRYENDVVLARQRARQIADLVGFESQDQVRIATGVSELARNAFRYAGGGKIEFAIEGATAPQVLYIRVTDHGPGIRNLQQILDGEYQSRTGMGLGLLGVRRLMDRCDIQTEPGKGTTVEIRKILPARSPEFTAQVSLRVADELGRQGPQNPYQEIQLQNQELIRTLDELRRRQDELARLNHELEDTNRGVVALYAELDEKADHLRRADELKSRFLSNMSHEFRTPLNSIMALARLLLDHSDGPLNSEQTKQLQFIRKAAQDLTELVNDLLDLAKVEAGKTDVRPSIFSLVELFGALRGMLKPLLVSESVALVFDPPEDVPQLYTDEAKVSQIVRNFISNALKFTEQGEVRVSAVYDAAKQRVTLRVADTGVGIAAADQDRIFKEFTQVDNPMQHKVKGTGLGLPLSRKLAELLGGTVSLQSEPGKGSIFSLELPLQFCEQPSNAPETVAPVESGKSLVLIVEDSTEDRHIYEKMFRNTQFVLAFAETVEQARQSVRQVPPSAIVLDVLLRVGDTWKFLAELKSGSLTSSIPVIVSSSIDDQSKAMALGANGYVLKPVIRHDLIHILQMLVGQRTARKILIIDDDENARYILKKGLTDPHHVLLEAENGKDGLRLAKQELPHVIVLDLVMPEMSGFEVLKELKTDRDTRPIPVIIHTSKHLEDSERTQLSPAAMIVSKGSDAAIDAIWDIVLDSGAPKLETRNKD